MDRYDDILTAKAWIIMNFKTSSYMRGANVQLKREIASLTKMYTLYGCLKINQFLNINSDKTFIRIIDILSNGTLANLQKDKFIRLKDLYYGMMLPSGNDAATLLAFYYGFWLDKQSTFPNLIFSKLRKVDLKDRIKHCNLFIKKFMQFINEKIIKGQLNHKITKLQNPHGLSNKFQVSNAWQIAEASIHFMKSSKEFRQIVKTKKYSGEYLNEQVEIKEDKNDKFEWANTNILLKQANFEGIKTGQTVTAGSCLSTYKWAVIKKKHEFQFLVVVLGCSTPEKRFQETKIIISDLQKHLEQIVY